MQPASGDHHPLMVTNVISDQALSGWRNKRPLGTNKSPRFGIIPGLLEIGVSLSGGTAVVRGGSGLRGSRSALDWNSMWLHVEQFSV
jgi:hypothetical protein